MPEKKEAVLVQDARVLTLEDTELPPIVNGESPPFYSHLEFPDGLRKVVKIRMRERRKELQPRKEEITLWYERPHTVGKDIIPLVFPCVSMVQSNLFEDCLYPVVVWNLSKKRLTSEIHSVPFDKLFPIIGLNGAPVYERGIPIMAFHYIVVNDRYVPNKLPNGKTDDGNFKPGEPVIGRHIIKQLQQYSAEAMSPLAYPRK